MNLPRPSGIRELPNSKTTVIIMTNKSFRVLDRSMMYSEITRKAPQEEIEPTPYLSSNLLSYPTLTTKPHLFCAYCVCVGVVCASSGWLVCAYSGVCGVGVTLPYSRYLIC